MRAARFNRGILSRVEHPLRARFLSPIIGIPLTGCARQGALRELLLLGGLRPACGPVAGHAFRHRLLLRGRHRPALPLRLGDGADAPRICSTLVNVLISAWRRSISQSYIAAPDSVVAHGLGQRHLFSSGRVCLGPHARRKRVEASAEQLSQPRSQSYR